MPLGLLQGSAVLCHSVYYTAMDKTVSQTTATPNNGASKSTDFQPQTRNPQSAPVNLFQQQSGIQNVTNTQELLSDQRNVRITVTSQPAAAPAEVAAANETPFVFIVAATLVVVIVGIYAIRKLRSNHTTPIQPLRSEPEVPAEINETVVLPKTTPKKKSKKAKRKHR